MQHVLKNKKLLITLLAGILLVTAAIGAGTYAWFTGTVTGSSEVKFATSVANLGIRQGDFNLLNFYDGHGDTIGAQRALEAGVLSGTQAEKNAALSAWLDLSQTSWGWNLIDYNTTTNPLNGQVNFIKNPFTKTDTATNKIAWSATPGSILQSSFDVTNLCSTPAYMRFKVDGGLSRVSLDTANFPNPDDLDYAITVAVSINEFDGDHNHTAADYNPANATIYDFVYNPVDEYYYCAEPLKSNGNARIIYLNMTAYLTSKNDNLSMGSAEITFGDIEVEVIQAQNNAVYLIGGEWTTAANSLNGGDFFIPYVESSDYDSSNP